VMNQLDTIKRLLENSDIVWSKYGSDTIQGLAERILNALGESTIDHEKLLIKYIRHVGNYEGINFIPKSPLTKDPVNHPFTLEELQELERLEGIADDQVRNELNGT